MRISQSEFDQRETLFHLKISQLPQFALFCSEDDHSFPVILWWLSAVEEDSASHREYLTCCLRHLLVQCFVFLVRTGDISRDNLSHADNAFAAAAIAEVAKESKEPENCFWLKFESFKTVPILMISKIEFLSRNVQKQLTIGIISTKTSSLKFYVFWLSVIQDWNLCLFLNIKL